MLDARCSEADGCRVLPEHRASSIEDRKGIEHRASQRGFALLYVFTLGALLAILVLMAWPDPLTQRKREREAELIYRGEHIARAIREFQQENNRYPTSLKEMMEVGPKNHRYLRQLYTEPVNPTGEWDLIPLGDPSTLAQLPNAQIAPVQPVAPPAADSFDSFSDSLLGKDGGLESAPLSGGDQRVPQRPLKIGRCRGAAGGAVQPGAGGISGLPGAAPIGQVIGTQIGVPIGTPLGTAGPGTQIVGVTSLVDEDSFREYQKKKKYCEWLFLANQPAPGARGQPMTPVGGVLNPPPPSR